MIERYADSENQILFFMDEVIWRWKNGERVDQHKADMLKHWEECYVKPGLVLRKKGYELRQSHDNIFAWFWAFRFFDCQDQLDLLLKDMDQEGWHLYEFDGVTKRKEGIMPPFLEFYCRMLATGNLSVTGAVYLTFHYIYTFFKMIPNLEFQRLEALKFMADKSPSINFVGMVAMLRHLNTDFRAHALGYHSQGIIHDVIAAYPKKK